MGAGGPSKVTSPRPNTYSYSTTERPAIAGRDEISTRSGKGSLLSTLELDGSYGTIGTSILFGGHANVVLALLPTFAVVGISVKNNLLQPHAESR